MEICIKASYMHTPLFLLDSSLSSVAGFYKLNEVISK